MSSECSEAEALESGVRGRGGPAPPCRDIPLHLPMDHVPLTFEHLVGSRSFFYVRVETDELLYFCMVNSLFSLMLETEPSNHLHSLIIPKKYLPLAARAPEGRR